MRICACIETSSADTGSSSTNSFGSDASALAMPIRWRWLGFPRFDGHFRNGTGVPGKEPSCQRANYTPEFRAEAVRLYRTSDRPLAEIAADLGISRESLRHPV